MSSRSRTALSEFRRSVDRVISTRSFSELFQSYCQRGDRHGMIKMLMDIEEVKRLRVVESYHRKDEDEARKIYEEYRRITAGNNGSCETSLAVSLLTEALFAARPTEPFFKEILLRRAGCWYSLGAFARCAKDCDYLMTTIREPNQTLSENRGESRANDEIKIECIALRAKCNEKLKRSKRNSRRSGIEKGGIGTLPRIDGRSNPKIPSCGDSVALRYDEARGRHLVATRNIKIGSVVMIDEPFAFSTDLQALRTNCLHCHASLDLEDNVKIPCHNCQCVAYCSNDCRRDSWLEYHRYECEIFDYFYETEINDVDPVSHNLRRSHLLLAWRTTVVAAVDRSTHRVNQLFLTRQRTLSNEETGSRENDLSIDPYDPRDYRTVFALETHCSDSSIAANLARAVRAVFLAKCLDLVLSKYRSASSPRVSIDTDDSYLVSLAVGILRHAQSVDCNAYEIVENRRDEATRVWEPRNVGGAIYTTVSLTNHACYPNVVRHSYPDGKVVVRALRFIAKGTEILDCYGPHFVSDSRTSRRRFLQDKFHFTCMCEACVKNFDFAAEIRATFKCTNCETSVDETLNECPKCGRSIDKKTLLSRLTKSAKKRLTAVAKMYEGNYAEALPFLLEHGALIDKILSEPNLEAIKTQQSIVQCWNSFSSVAPSIRSSV